jgi:hypothetical protein
MGDAQFFVQAVQVGQHLGLAPRVQRGQRLVHQQQRRAGGQGARDGHALALAAGQAWRAAAAAGAHAQQVHHLVQRDAAVASAMRLRP